jgi:hypothetical protein
MAQVLVRNVDDNAIAAIKRKAKLHRRSMQNELRHLIEEAARAPDTADQLTVFPPVTPVHVKGKPASAALVADRR